MSERAKRANKQEPYTYSLYVPSQKSEGERPKAELDLGNQEGYMLDEPTVAEDSNSMLGIGSPVQESKMMEAPRAHNFANPRPNGIYRVKHHSLKTKSSLLEGLHFGGNMRIRIGALAGWSAMAGAGAFALFTRAGPFPGTQLAELGAVWGGIAAFLWIIIAKLKN